MMIRAFVFDLGGVLLRTTDFSPREELALRMGMSRSELEGFIFGGESGERAQRGEISVSQHWQNLARQLNYSEQQMKTLVDEFFAHDELDLKLLDYIRRLHQDYKTALLSNAWDDTRQVMTSRWHFEQTFDEIIISSEVGILKPDPRIFRLTLDCLGVEPHQAIFVDDMQRNVDGAIAVGLQAIRFQNLQQMVRELEQILPGLAR
ncbi:MAG: HAD family hydrolase [Acidobacteriaceae bacterium]